MLATFSAVYDMPELAKWAFYTFLPQVAVVNLDPANDVLPFKPDIDISDLITITDVMENLKLGPNGGLVRTNFLFSKCRFSNVFNADCQSIV